MISNCTSDRTASTLRRGVGILLLTVLPTTSYAAPFNCKTNRCGLLAKASYPNLVLGSIERIADKNDMRAVFKWAHAHGYWNSLPANGKGYLDAVKMLSLSVPNSHGQGKRSITVLMTPEEFNLAPLHVGELVRYSPHGAKHERAERPTDPIARAYWDLVGCVALICRKTDHACWTRYRTGVYRKKDGREINASNGQMMAHGTRIDPISLFPVAK